MCMDTSLLRFMGRIGFLPRLPPRLWRSPGCRRVARALKLLPRLGRAQCRGHRKRCPDPFVGWPVQSSGQESVSQSLRVPGRLCVRDLFEAHLLGMSCKKLSFYQVYVLCGHGSSQSSSSLKQIIPFLSGAAVPQGDIVDFTQQH